MSDNSDRFKEFLYPILRGLAKVIYIIFYVAWQILRFILIVILIIVSLDTGATIPSRSDFGRMDKEGILRVLLIFLAIIGTVSAVFLYYKYIEHSI